MIPDTVHQIYGHVSPAEMELLNRLAREVPADGVIVEIGSFQGKSTVCLGLGAKQNGAKVFAIDPHEDHQVNDSTHYGMENHAALLKNLVDHQIADVVRVVTVRSEDLVETFPHRIDLLWIDGLHDYHDVLYDLEQWSKNVSPTGRILVHDSSGHFPGVTGALENFLTRESWAITQQVDATAVLERSNV